MKTVLMTCDLKADSEVQFHVSEQTIHSFELADKRPTQNCLTELSALDEGVLSTLLTNPK